ncbi:MAG: NAD(P)H-dependent oxidoreductase [Deltaproteobacteria bacterium]|nr:NAD(P)H-dependent oxidoreductase [Deltaproteobacteria bacterium]
MSIILSLVGSPRKEGSSERLLRLLLEEIEGRPFLNRIVHVSDFNISPCQGCRFCEEKGYCRIKDDMEQLYFLFGESDLILIATPIFFYNFPAQFKALIDRMQTLWARKYRLGLNDPKRDKRYAFIVAVGATKGKNLFLGLELTAKYFLDAVGAKLFGLWGLRGVDKPQDIFNFPESLEELRDRAKGLIETLSKKKRILFLCRENACRSQMAEAFFQLYGGDQFEALSAGDKPASQVNPKAIEVMAEQGLDIFYRKPKNLNNLLGLAPFDWIVTMGCEINCPVVPAKKRVEWQIEDPSHGSLQKFREVRDKIHEKVKELMEVVKNERA